MPTLPLTYELTAYNGTTMIQEFRWLPGGTNPQDFTGWAAVMRVGRPGGVALIDVDSLDGGVTLTAAGQIILELSAEQTASLKAGIYSYVVDLIDPGDKTTRFLRGRFELVEDVRAG